MNIKRALLWVGAVAAVIVVAVAGAFLYSMHSLATKPIFTASQANDIETALKGSVGEVIFGPVQSAKDVSNRTGLDALLTAERQASLNRGLIEAYQRDPEGLKRYAQRFDTSVHAMRVAETVAANETAYALPISSSNLPLQAEDKLDAWKHPYCVSDFEGRLVIVSGGPSVRTFSCVSQQFRRKELGDAARKLFQTEQGEVVLLLNRDDVARANIKRTQVN